MNKVKSVTLLSGGMDSATMAFMLAAQGVEQDFLVIDYGQRHNKEIWAAYRVYDAIKDKWADQRCSIIQLDFTDYSKINDQSSLTGTADVPHGHYAEESMKSTVVPGRNAFFLSVAYGMAAARNHDMVSIAAHAGDHFIYPDCRPAFIEAIEVALVVSLDGLNLNAGKQPGIHAPFLNLKKKEIAAIGLAFDLPYEITWTCYEGEDKHCGKCGACNERKEAFALNNAIDPTEYAQ